MATKAPAIVRGKDGLLGTIVDRETDDPGDPSMLDVLLDDGRRLLVPAEFLVLQGDGSYELAVAAGEVDRFSKDAEHDAEVVMPVVAESVEVDKRTIETGQVRVRKTVRSTEKVVDEPVIHEEVEVERVPVNRVIDVAIGPRQEGDTLIVPLLEEVLVVEKRLILREEVRITRRRSERRSPRKITLRSEEATIERSDGEGPVDDKGL